MKFPQWLALTTFLAAVVLLWSLRDVLIHLFAAVVLAMAICTLVGAIRKHSPGMSRSQALLITIFGLVLVVALALAVIVPPFIDQFYQLIVELPRAWSELRDLAAGLLNGVSAMIYGAPQESSDWSSRLREGGLTTLPSGSDLAAGLQQLVGLAGNLGSGLLQIIFVLAVALMVSVQPMAYREVAILLLPSFYRHRARTIMFQCGKALSSWMIGVLISSICVGVLAGIGLSLLGIKLVIANAVLAGMLNVIPNIGPTLSTIFPMSVALLDAPWKAVAVLGLYVVVQNLESYVITPSVMQYQVNLLPGFTLTAQFIFTVLFGPLGLLLALPLTVMLQVLIREVIVRDLLDSWG
ncbi:AI-2E family transporter [cyanobiont of Ornithocercus magnificus]|nr:AI-2E family transporter [cyanobiont of Ornithocercus magnificus]